MATVEELERQIAELRRRLDAIPPQSPQMNTFAQNSDVKLGTTGNPLTDLDVATWIAADNAWENRPSDAGAGTDGFYGQSNTIGTSAASDCDFSTLVDGATLLDVSTATAPTVLTAGLYTFSVTAIQTHALTVPFDLQCAVRFGTPTVRAVKTTAATPFGFEALALTALMAAGDPVTVSFANNDPAVTALVTILVNVARS